MFASERLTGALRDQLTHHVHILEMSGDSYRLKQSKRRSRSAPADTRRRPRRSCGPAAPRSHKGIEPIMPAAGHGRLQCRFQPGRLPTNPRRNGGKLIGVAPAR